MSRQPRWQSDAGITIGKVVAFIAIAMLVGRRLIAVWPAAPPPARAGIYPFVLARGVRHCVWRGRTV